MDITPLFKACIKTVRTRNKAFGIHSPSSEDKQRILRTKPKTAFMITAKDITLQITKLRDFMLEHRERYLSFFNSVTGDEMSEAERDQIDTGAQRIINTCSHLLKEFRNDNRKLSVSQQTRDYMDAVIDLIDSYLKSVCKIHSELKALRVKRALDIRKLSRLEQPQTKSSIPNPFIDNKIIEQEEEKDEENGELSAEELQMFESENVQLLNELNSMTEEVRQIESKVLHIAELQEIFTEKVLQQEQDIDRIANTVVGTTETMKDANEQIKQAIQRNAGLRVYILFFLLVMSFTLLFLDCDHQECQANYEVLGAAVTDHIYYLLETELNLIRLPVPKGSTEKNGTFIFVCPDFDKQDVLLVLIHGSGAVRAGQWARSLIINDCLDTGTQIPYIKKAQAKGYGILVLNSNDNFRGDNKISHSSSAEEHANYVWKTYIKPTKAASILIVAHSYGGILTVLLADKEKKEFEKRVKAIALTDSVHGYSGVKISKYLKQVSKNWISSTSPLDAPMKTPDFDITRVSAGTI
ncbi:Syntaxin-18 [Danaus plexippus plexippus]|uniref:Syntaxin-18 n=1 Tax=Danaus plexippus plexippus TaxID=278856 RepID=A0A212FCM4_DANPL|nr:Syntaxin-18 [Danaus plexippus plexippus]